MASIDKVNVGGTEYNIQPGEVVPVELGGTGASTAEQARKILSAASSDEFKLSRATSMTAGLMDDNEGMLFVIRGSNGKVLQLQVKKDAIYFVDATATPVKIGGVKWD